MHSFEIVQDDYSYVNENLNLDYIDEIELNEAFSVFEKAIWTYIIKLDHK